MSFTQDELQSFNTILEQKLSIYRRELEHSFDQRMNVLKGEFEQQFASIVEDILRNLPPRLSEQQNQLRDTLGQQIRAQQARIEESVSQKIEQQPQMLEAVIEGALAAQLLAIEQLINQRWQSAEQPQMYTNEARALDSIEVQTEVSWEDLVSVINRALADRLTSLEGSVQSMVKNTERYLLSQLHILRNDLAQGKQNYTGNISSMQDVFASIEQLERIIESMQVAMTANHALLSNRLYHHQHLPLERAHATSQAPTNNNIHEESKNNELPQPQEQKS